MQYSVMSIGAVVFSVLISVAKVHGNEKWTYDDEDAKGPHAWVLEFSECGGERNSPINIDTQQTVKAQLPKWHLHGWDSSFLWNVTNEQYTTRFDLSSKPGSITTQGGALRHKYDLVQFHFHWGKFDSKGSEHKINGKAYPMEMHCVHKQSKFLSVAEALRSKEPDALAVFAFFFQIQERDNEALNKMITGIRRTQKIEQSAGFQNVGYLHQLVDGSLEGDFWRYDGSLTTPSCAQEVVWTVFKNPIGISESQMKTFRMAEHGRFGSELYRPVQELNGRTVVEYQKDYNENTFLKELLMKILSDYKQGGN